ncbi:hypothetical protein VOLCADRAFT_81178 [Volvox carteri f. nagariensis]|uniref:Peptidase M20 dimerisation domain-containing protein n=1 Tax=Volvox carteri f. nagariensis TaxID=3068 RepID=D8TW55_VOLCA|nr:uncharacterized protein VOLCADRAFT_81178 [Volvox carteri f. nagariensis]EFJ48310.1 hypothetical protein VOLCADRAFT_81178 [Volvox carteri f. nagariensis]|eukprot:XP_002950564.1 hypothetical protein VOLCADRAFT_81178 [Volvox carteri f. nagariensis]
MPIHTFELDEKHFLDLLEKLIGEAGLLQNNPPEAIPKEDRAGRHVLDVLQPFSEDEGGPLRIRHISYVEGRGNIIVEYPGEPDGGIMSFVGCHLDVVTADPQTWAFDPFKLTQEGDQLRGRGTTDCLGHVALLTELFRQLGEKRPKLKRTIVGVYIANEENSKVLGIGIDKLVEEHLLDNLRAGPLYWVDVADSQPCIGTGGILAWSLKVYGKMFHSGLPHKSINPIELAMAAVQYMQDRFYADFPAHPEEARYGFATPSTMKPTQWVYPGGSINQIPGQATVCGDCRITPFYDVDKVMEKLRSYVDELNSVATGALEALPVRGPCSKWVVVLEVGGGGRKGWTGPPGLSSVRSCDLARFHAMTAAFTRVYGFCTPYAITGSLPCIRELQEAGYDVQCIGFGRMATYHAVNEYALLSDFKKGFQVMRELLLHFNNN